MCQLCALRAPTRRPRGWLMQPRPESAAGDATPALNRRAALRASGAVAAGAALASPQAWAQVDVGAPSTVRKLVPAETLERAAAQQYQQTLAEARAQRALAPDDYPALVKLRGIAQRLITHALPWNERAKGWRWEINLIGSKQINAWCMPGGKIAFYTGILNTLKLTEDEAAMIMGHEMAHALREHARERVAKSEATNIGLRIGAQLLGLGDLGNVAANMGAQLLSLKYGRDDETEADLVGLEIAARGGFDPDASVALWQKMGEATGNAGPPAWLSTHPKGPDRIKELQANIPKVRGLYQAAPKQ